VKLYDELALELGHAVWAFARIEKVTFQYLDLLSKEVFPLLMKRVSLDGRFGVMLELVGQVKPTQHADVINQAKQQAITVIESVVKLAER
jgi:hypothetical protein